MTCRSRTRPRREGCRARRKRTSSSHPQSPPEARRCVQLRWCDAFRLEAREHKVRGARGARGRLARRRTVEPLISSSEDESTTTRAPACSNTSSSSSSSDASSSAKLYWKPEHPPGSTDSRSSRCASRATMPLLELSWMIRCGGGGAERARVRAGERLRLGARDWSRPCAAHLCASVGDDDAPLLLLLGRATNAAQRHPELRGARVPERDPPQRVRGVGARQASKEHGNEVAAPVHATSGPRRATQVFWILDSFLRRDRRPTAPRHSQAQAPSPTRPLPAPPPLTRSSPRAPIHAPRGRPPRPPGSPSSAPARSSAGGRARET